MAQKVMFPGMVNSPETTITNNINESDTIIYVLDPARVPEPPNLMTLGTGTNAETIKVLEINDNAITVERGFQGVAKSWPAGTVIARNFTEYDYRALKENIEDLEANKETPAGAQAKADAAEAAAKAYADQEVAEVSQALDAHVAENMSYIGVNPGGIWIPPAQPSARADQAGHFADAINWDANEFINNLFEPLRAQEINYITRSSLGKDTSNTYDIWKYEFTPPSYEKTIIIGGALHGSEVHGILGIYRFLYHLVNDWKEHPQLAYVRWKVKLIVIPIQNPWGVSQSPRVRQNANGVDLNRNFNYKWAEYTGGTNPFDHDYKGTAPFSEVESQYIRDVFIANPDSIAYIDMHNMSAGLNRDFVLFTPQEESIDRNVFRKIIESFALENNVIGWGESSNPSAFNYAASNFQMHASNPEFSPASWDNAVFDSKDVYECVKWFGNVILQHAHLQTKTDFTKYNEPFTVLGRFEAIGSPTIDFPLDTYGELEDLRLTIDIPTTGILLVQGSISIRGTDDASQNFIAPFISQSGNSFPSTQLGTTATEVYNEGMERSTLNFQTAAKVYPSLHNNVYFGKVNVGIKARNTAGTVTVFRYRVVATFIPSNRGDRAIVYSATGNQGTGAGAMVQIYP